MSQPRRSTRLPESSGPIADSRDSAWLHSSCNFVSRAHQAHGLDNCLPPFFTAYFHRLLSPLICLRLHPLALCRTRPAPLSTSLYRPQHMPPPRVRALGSPFAASAVDKHSSSPCKTLLLLTASGVLRAQQIQRLHAVCVCVCVWERARAPSHVRCDRVTMSPVLDATTPVREASQHTFLTRLLSLPPCPHAPPLSPRSTSNNLTHTQNAPLGEQRPLGPL